MAFLGQPGFASRLRARFARRTRQGVTAPGEGPPEGGVPHPNISRFALSGAQTESYQPSDWEAVDYEMYEFADTGFYFRGPDRDGLGAAGAAPAEGAIAVLGAASVFGRFCAVPFTQLLEERCGRRVYNFGFWGASPGSFLAQERLLEFAGACSMCILQILSARSVSNSIIECSDSHPNWVARRSDGHEMFVNEAYRHALVDLPPNEMLRIVDETRERYVLLMAELVRRIGTAVHLLWFADRAPAYVVGFDSFGSLYGGFPQLVDETVLDCLRPAAAGVIEVVSSSGRPHHVFNRFASGRQPVAVLPHHDPPHENYYYPTPEMHIDAAAAVAGYIASDAPRR